MSPGDDAGNGSHPAEALVEHDAEAEHVGLGPELLVADLLGRRVHRRAGRQCRFGASGLGCGESDPEITEERVARVVEEDVGGLDVSVHHAGGVRCRERPADLSRERHRLVDRESTVVESAFERPARQPTHHEIRRVGVAPVVDQRDDVGVFDAGDQMRLGLEAPDELRPRGEFGADLLDRHLAFHRRLHPSPHDRERPASRLFQQPIAAERDTDRLDVEGGIGIEDRSFEIDHLR